MDNSYSHLAKHMSQGDGDDCASRNDVAEAVTIFEDLYSTARRVFGAGYPLVVAIQRDLARGREHLAAFDAP